MSSSRESTYTVDLIELSVVAVFGSNLAVLIKHELVYVSDLF